jgi:cobalt-zinc-cadmium efflux system outer membrane protein
MSTTTDRAQRARLGAVAGTFALLTLAGCASVQRDARFPEVQETVGQRLESNVAWNRDSEQDRRAREAVRRLLQQELTAQAAVQIALLNNRNLQASYESLGVAQANLVEAGLLENPVFSITLYSGHAGTITEASVVQDFVGVVSLSARKKVGEAAAQRVTLEVANNVVALARQVQVQYFTVVGDAQALELARQVVTAAEAAAELAQRQRSAGNLNRRDQSLQQAFYAQTLLESAQAEAQLASDRERLNRLMGVWGEDTGWKIPSRLPAVPNALPSLEQVEAQAVSQRLELAAAKKAADAAAQALSLTRQFRYLGPFGIGVAYKREPGGDKFVGPTVELGLPIFNQGQAAVARAEAELKRSEERVAALAVDIRSEAREARSRVAAAHEVVRHYREVMLPLQQTIVSETLKFYNGMLVGVYDLLLAKQAQVQTARQYVWANKEFWLAWTDLELALGGKVPLPAARSADGRPAAGASPASDGADPSNNSHRYGGKQS